MKKTMYILCSVAFALSALALVPSDAVAASASLHVYRPVKSIEVSESSRIASNRLVIINVGKGAAKSVIVHDILRDSEGDIVRDEVWDLGTIESGEVVELSYDMYFGDDAVADRYSLDAKVTGKNMSKASIAAKGIIYMGEAVR